MKRETILVHHRLLSHRWSASQNLSPGLIQAQFHNILHRKLKNTPHRTTKKVFFSAMHGLQSFHFRIIAINSSDCPAFESIKKTRKRKRERPTRASSTHLNQNRQATCNKLPSLMIEPIRQESTSEEATIKVTAKSDENIHFVCTNGKMYALPTIQEKLSNSGLIEMNMKLMKNGFLGVCLFCEKTFTKSKSNWISHFTAHTDERQYRCDGCRSSKSYNQKCRTTSCQSTQVIQIHKFILENDALNGYVCKCCGLTLLSSENLRKHVQAEHNIELDLLDAYCVKYKIMQFPPNSRRTMKIVQNNETVPVPHASNCNSPISDEQQAKQQVSIEDSGKSDASVILSSIMNANAERLEAADQLHTLETHPSGSWTIATAQLIELKPWIYHLTTKTATMAAYMLDDICLFAFYKCMGPDCMFSCQSKQRMLDHLKVHEMFDKSAKKDYLECAYCNEVSLTCPDLIHHINITHINSHFQCQYCFYRGADAYGVLLHQRKYHCDKKRVILFCNGYNRTIRDIHMEELVRKQIEAVTPINCVTGRFFRYISQLPVT